MFTGSEPGWKSSPIADEQGSCKEPQSICSRSGAAVKCQEESGFVEKPRQRSTTAAVVVVVVEELEVT
jgi:hypothetical protein